MNRRTLRTNKTRPLPLRTIGLCGWVLLAQVASAQESAPTDAAADAQGAVVRPGVAAEPAAPTISVAPKVLIKPRVSAGMTMTNNVRPGEGAKRKDTITSITPGVRVSGKGGRVSGELDFGWENNLYAKNSRLNDDRKTLTASATAELVDQWLYLDAGANMARTPISVFGAQTGGNDLATINHTQTRSYNLSPYVRGMLLGDVRYELRYKNAQTKSDGGVFAAGSGVTSNAWNGQLSGPTPFTQLGWSLLADDQQSKFSAGSTKSNRVLGKLEFQVDPQIRLNVSAGSESDNYTTTNLRRRTVSGFGGDWAPTERTALKLAKDKRSYGNGHAVDFSHRTAQTAWKFSDTRSVIVPAQQFATGQVSTAYEMLFQQLAGSIPDPIARADAVRAMLLAMGISPTSPIYGSIMSASPFMERRQQASVSLTGVYNTVTFGVQRSRNDNINTGVAALGDFAQSQNIRQSGLTANWSYRLTPDSSLALNALSSQSKGNLASLETELRSLTLLYTTQLGRDTTASVGLRRNAFDSSGAAANNYTEHAVTGTLTATF